jgi:3-hydroxybutyryl-CoA dehydrogenase
MKHIGIIGYGKMGASIFKLFSELPALITVVTETRQEANCAAEAFYKKLDRSLKRKTISLETHSFHKTAIKFTHCLEDLGTADFVIEAIFEDFQMKSDLFRRLESFINPRSILVSNTSSLSIRQLSLGLQYPARFCGFHFFNPVPLINLVEIIRTDATEPELIGHLRSVSENIGKNAIVVNDAPGSVINAVLAYYYIEGIFLLEDGLMLPSEIDRTAKQFFYVGPCESLDVIGMDFFVSASKNAIRAGTIYPIRDYLNNRGACPIVQTDSQDEILLPFLIEKLLSSGRLGRKVSMGIYSYDGMPMDEALEFYRDPSRTALLEAVAERQSLATLRLLYAVFNGSLFSLFHRMASMEDIDCGMSEILHMKKGPFAMMKDIGLDELERNYVFLNLYAGNRFVRPDTSLLKSIFN